MYDTCVSGDNINEHLYDAFGTSLEKPWKGKKQNQSTWPIEYMVLTAGVLTNTNTAWIPTHKFAWCSCRWHGCRRLLTQWTVHPTTIPIWCMMLLLLMLLCFFRLTLLPIWTIQIACKFWVYIIIFQCLLLTRTATSSVLK